MIIREQNLNDLRLLEQDATFPLGKRKPFASLTIENTSEDPIGVFNLHNCIEIELILKKNGSPLERARAIKALADHLISRIHGVDVHLFISDDEFYYSLKKHFQFEDIIGRPLVRRT